MATYKNASILTQKDVPEFDRVYPPGAHAPTSGIYRCKSCGYEVVSTAGNKLPPENSDDLLHVAQALSMVPVSARPPSVVKVGSASVPHSVAWQLVVAPNHL
ncbi:hypothetical protein [Sorangium sp. So ce1078]|uniref:hypothetical protein n=1 Tax=Sorangium sp. So ce1078 TaxID=3133329 RepID=UPI003F5FAC17